MEKSDLERNIVDCSGKIASYTARLSVVDHSGEDKGDLQKNLDGYVKTRTRLSKMLELIKEEETESGA